MDTGTQDRRNTNPGTAEAATVRNAKRARPNAAGIAPLGYAYLAVALAEAVTWAGLLVGMYQKHLLGLEDNLVPLFGSLHGLVFMLYQAVAFVAARSFGWSLRTTLVTMAAGVPPFLTIPVEIWLRRTGRLAPRLDTPAGA